MTIRKGSSIIAGCASSSNIAETVKDQNNALIPLKAWVGTKAQYDAIVTKDNNTLYNITDDNTAVAYQAYTKSEVNSLIEAIYPIGSIYIGTQLTCPLETLISGSTWIKVSEGRVLQGSDSGHSAGTTVEAGLPNIMGGLGTSDQLLLYNNTYDRFSYSSGAFLAVYEAGNVCRNSGTVDYTTDSKRSISFDASRSSSIYGNSNTVQPPAYIVNVWQRTA